MKALVALLLVAAIAALGAAGFFMLGRRRMPGERDARMARALAWRVGLSVALFVLILVAASLGWIEPHSLAPGR